MKVSTGSQASSDFSWALRVGKRVRIGLILAVATSLLGLASPAVAQNSWQGLHPLNTLDFWSNAGEWSLGTVPDGSTDINIAFDDVGGDTSFTNRHTLTIGGPARLIVFSPTTITNSGTSAFINNSGSLLNNGTITNSSSGTMNNIGVISNNGTLFNQLGAQLNNDLELDNNGALVNRLSGTIVNTGNLNNNSGGFLTNDLSSTITNNNNLINASGGNVSNFGTLNGTGSVVNLGTVDNFGSLKNVVVNFGGTINNSGGGSVQFANGSAIQGGTLNNAAGFLGVTGNGATATLDSTSSFGAVTIQGTYTTDVGSTTTLVGTINNQGNIQVNSGGGASTLLNLGSDVTLQGGGTVTLANLGGTGSSVINADVGRFTLTNVDNTIQGAGSIFVNAIVVNQAGGTINANVAGQVLTIESDKPFPNTNAGLMEATGGGILLLTPGKFNLGGTMDNRGGTIAANGGEVLLSGLSTQGGTITALNGGSVNMLAMTVMGGTLNNVSGTLEGTRVTLDGSTGFGAVTIQGTYTTDVGSTTTLVGTINNQGNIQVNSGGGASTLLNLGSDVTLQGGGTVTLANLGGTGSSVINADVGRFTLTNVDNTIQGAGSIFVNAIVVNQAGGTINANVAGQVLTIESDKPFPNTNAGLMEATGGGILLLTPGKFNLGGTMDNRGGTIAANDGEVLLSGLSTQGGTITALNGGSVSMLAMTVMGGTLNNVSGTLEGTRVTLDGSTGFGAVTIQGTYTTDVGSTTTLVGTINNQGNIQLTGGGGKNSTLTLQSDMILQGGGTVTLASTGGGGAGVINSALVGLTLTNAGNTIQGAGLIDGGAGALALVNQAGGTIRANAPGGTLEILSSTLTNAGTVQVDAGSTLQVISTPFSQTGGKTQVDGLMGVTQGEFVSGGTILGTGKIGGNITMTGGTMHPGSVDAPGALTIFGDIQQSGSIFDELISASGNGLLTVNGLATLGQFTDLDIAFLDGFTPFAGETFTIMEFTNGFGVFANAPSTGFEMAGFDWTIAYNANSIVLDAVAPVKGDGGGGGGGGEGGGTSVPEPGTGVLLLGALAVVFAGSLFRKNALASRI